MSDWENYSENLAFDPAKSMPRCDIEELKAKVKKLEDKLKIAYDVISDVEFWLNGMVGAMNNECAEHNKKQPVGNFEYAFKSYADSLRDLNKKIKE